MIPFTLRIGRPSDLPFVVDSWVKRGRAPTERIGEATTRVRAILAEASSELRVAHLPDDEDAILGWAVLTNGAPQYVYVRRGVRGHGIASALLA